MSFLKRLVTCFAFGFLLLFRVRLRYLSLVWEFVYIRRWSDRMADALAEDIISINITKKNGILCEQGKNRSVVWNATNEMRACKAR